VPPFERRQVIDRQKRAVVPKDRRLAGLQVHVTGPSLDGTRQQGVEVHPTLIGSRVEWL
jgi:hypothetical protein